MLAKKESDELINKQNKRGETPLFLCAKYGLNDHIRLLLSRGANVDYPDAEGNSPLHMAACWGHENTIQLLIEQGCKFYTRNKKGWSAVDYSATHDIANSLQMCAINLFENRKRRSLAEIEE